MSTAQTETKPSKVVRRKLTLGAKLFVLGAIAVLASSFYYLVTVIAEYLNV